MKLNNNILVILIIVLFFGSIYIADQLGLWQTESTKQPKKFSEGEFEGMPNPDDIRGSYSFMDIEKAFEVEIELIAEAFGIKRENPGDIQAKELETIYSGLGENIEIGTGSVRFFVSLYTGLPYEGFDYLPYSAVEVLKNEGKWNDEMEQRTDGYVIVVDGDKENFNIEVDNNQEQEIQEEHEEEIAVKGKTTVNDVITWGISKQNVEKIMGVIVENENMLIRDICETNGLSFSEIKVKLNDLLENK